MIRRNGFGWAPGIGASSPNAALHELAVARESRFHFGRQLTVAHELSEDGEIDSSLLQLPD